MSHKRIEINTDIIYLSSSYQCLDDDNFCSMDKREKKTYLKQTQFNNQYLLLKSIILKEIFKKKIMKCLLFERYPREKQKTEVINPSNILIDSLAKIDFFYYFVAAVIIIRFSLSLSKISKLLYLLLV